MDNSTYNNIRELFDFLNDNGEYLVLRNWDELFNESIYSNGHEDIDVLCRDIKVFKSLTKAKRIHINRNLDKYIVPCGNLKIRFDIRWVGDGYYPSRWEDEMLNNKVLSDSGVYIMNQTDYCYSLAYHAILQKPKLSKEYFQKIQESYKMREGKPVPRDEQAMVDDLKLFLTNNSYHVILPKDPAVYVNWDIMKEFNQHKSSSYLLRRLLYKYSLLLERILRIDKTRMCNEKK